MGLGLYLYGDCTRPRDALLEGIRAWVAEACRGQLLSAHIGEAADDRRTLWLNLHPGEEEFEVKAVGTTRLLASAKTSGAGPGYHAFVCELLDQLSERFGVRWQAVDPTGETGDDTGYFHRRDRAALERQMLDWLRAVARSLDSRGAEGWSGIAVAMPMDVPQYEIDAAVTALGPRGADFWQRVQRDDDAAREFFPWWEPGRGAGYLLGRALCRMWSDVRWREPLNDVEMAVHADVLDHLERAYALDPKRSYPLVEWAELAQLNGRTSPPPPPPPPRAGAPRIGYRRGTLLARPFPGASIRIPGSFSEAFDKHGSWSAWGEGRTVWMSFASGKRTSPGAEPLVDQPDPVADTTVQEGETVFRVHGRRVHVSGEEVRLLTVSILFAEKEDTRWALETWRSLQFG